MTYARCPVTLLIAAAVGCASPTPEQQFIGDAAERLAVRTVGLSHVAGNPPSDTMLMVHLPAERVVIEVDAYSPAAQAHPYAANFVDNIVRRKLQVDRVVRLHGAIAPFADLLAHGAAQSEGSAFSPRR